nr:N-acetylmannosamine-6-phosphate 2-epimerase [Vallitalea pronyensis]
MTDIIRTGLIVSCQALSHEPLHSSFIMAKMSLAAYEGGAVCIRANSYEDIKAIKEEVDLPIIGLVKRDYDDSPIYITPTMREVREVAEAGAEVVAIDATHRIRPKGELLVDMVKQIKTAFPSLYMMADVATLEEAIYAESIGFDLVSSTLNGYTEYTMTSVLPNLDLVEAMTQSLSIPVIAEGGIWDYQDTRKALEKGAYAVVVGTAITRPQEITKKFVSAMKELL